LYKTFLKKDGEIHFKTDDDNLFMDSLNYFENAGYQIIWKTFDLHSENIENNIVTEHEAMFSNQGIKIKALIAKI
jgi:tRNA (guanine-N7-)-methyltransferase